MRYFGIRAWLLFVALAPIAAMAVAMLAFLANLRMQHLGTELEAQAQSIGKEWVPAIEEALSHNDIDTLHKIASAAVESKNIGRLRIRNLQGQILVDAREYQPSESLSTLLSRLLLTLPAGKRLNRPAVVLRLKKVDQVTTSPAAAPAPLGTVEIEMSTHDAIHEQLTGLFLSALLALVLLSCAGLLGMVTANHILATIRRMIRQIRQLEQGHLDTLPHAKSHAELGELETALDAMTQALRQRQYQLQEQVRRMTSELRQTLRAVEVQNVELDVARKRALEASKVKSQFLANVSHEIRTPINGIVGFADLLHHSPLDAEQRDYVDTIKESCTNLLAIINDILDFSKIEAGKLELDNRAFDLRDSIEEVLSLLAPTAYGKELELVQLIYSDVPVMLHGDPIRIQQVLTNLLHNAIKFTQQGRIVVRVMLEEETETEARLRLTVSDTGIGLTEEDRSKLFRAFSQAGDSPTRHFGGTGLGLIISKKLIEQMGGMIGLESEPKQGSTFWFTLSLQKQRGSHRVESRRSSPLAGRRMLLLDEELLSRLATKHLLTAWGINSVIAENQAGFLLRLERDGPWDAAVMGLTRHALHNGPPEMLFRHCAKAHVPLLILASTVDRDQLHTLNNDDTSIALPKAIRRQTIFRELCRLVATHNLPALPAPPRESTRPADAAVPSSGSQTRVLVVDDNEINRKLMTAITMRHDACVDEARDGLEAVAHCQEQNYDLIFMDIQMPRLGGVEAAQRINALYRGKQRPRIIALTANAMPGERERLRALGLDECLIKPITEEQVIQFMGRRLIGATAARHRGSSSGEIATGSENHPGEEIRRMLQVELPQHRRLIREAYRKRDRVRLREHVHRLHGAVSICRLPTLKSACQNMEEALIQNNHNAIARGMKQLLAEIANQLGDAQRNRSSPRLPV